MDAVQTNLETHRANQRPPARCGHQHQQQQQFPSSRHPLVVRISATIAPSLIPFSARPLIPTIRDLWLGIAGGDSAQGFEWSSGKPVGHREGGFCQGMLGEYRAASRGGAGVDRAPSLETVVVYLQVCWCVYTCFMVCLHVLYGVMPSACRK